MKNFIPFILLLLSFTGFAQVDLGKYGSISGSFESISQLYIKDVLTNAVFPQDRIGSNNYMKVSNNFI